MNNTANSNDTIANFTNYFLVAMPGLQDPHFAQSVTYIFEHNSDGAGGLVINQPNELTLADLFGQLSLDDLSSHAGDQPLMSGGPLHTDRGFILHDGDRRWDSTLVVNNDLCVTTSKDILTDMALDAGPKNSLVTLGCASWEAGQLEQEITDNSWLLVPADKHILFRTETDKRWADAASKLGIDLTLISPQAGHA